MAAALFLLLAFVKPLQKFFILTAAKITCRKKSDEEKNAFITEQTLKYEIYREQIKLMPKKTARYILPFFLYIADMFLSASSVYAAYLFSAGTIFSVKEYFSFYIATLAATYITNIIPIPGGSGSSVPAHIFANFGQLSRGNRSSRMEIGKLLYAYNFRIRIFRRRYRFE